MCFVLDVSLSGFYFFIKNGSSKKEEKKLKIIRTIEKIHLGSRKIYGSPRVFKILKGMGISCSKTKVERLMREFGIKSKIKRKYRPSTTHSNHKMKVADNILNRDFSLNNEKPAWAGDITYIGTKEGWLYLAVTMDLRTRKILGWGMSDKINTKLIEESFEMALKAQNPCLKTGILFHSDRGAQYASQSFKALLERSGFIQSMSRKGECHDNACVESFFHTLKGEYVSFQSFETREEARNGIFEWIEVFYNRERIHSSLDFMSPQNYTEHLKKISLL